MKDISTAIIIAGALIAFGIYLGIHETTPDPQPPPQEMIYSVTTAGGLPVRLNKINGEVVVPTATGPRIIIPSATAASDAARDQIIADALMQWTPPATDPIVKPSGP
jgi:hypothetical protein